MADEVSAAEGTKRAVILKAAGGGEVSIQEMLEAIAQLEKQRQRKGIESLEGEWLLIWTSGTKKYQELKPNNSQKLIQISSRRNQVIQRFDIQQRQLENEVKFPFGSLVVAGKFEYTSQQRIQFTCSQMRSRLGKLKFQLPLGKFAQGWLQTTYIDKELHIERGDRGGVSVYVKNN